MSVSGDPVGTIAARNKNLNNKVIVFTYALGTSKYIYRYTFHVSCII